MNGVVSLGIKFSCPIAGFERKFFSFHAKKKKKENIPRRALNLAAFIHGCSSTTPSSRLEILATSIREMVRGFNLPKIWKTEEKSCYHYPFTVLLQRQNGMVREDHYNYS